MKKIYLMFTIFAALSCAATAQTTAINSDEAASRVAQLQDADSNLINIAAIMVRAEPKVSRVWTGFWRKDQPFLLLRPTESALLISSQKPPDLYIPLTKSTIPPELLGRVYLRQVYPPEFGKNSFATVYKIDNNIVVPALEPKGSNLFNQLDFYYHEAFHGYQEQNFTPASNEPRAKFKQPSVDPTHIAAPDFAAMAEVERRILINALDVSPGKNLRSLLRQYLAVRRMRSKGLSDVIARERLMERTEGTAEFVGCSAATLATNAPASRLRDCIREELTTPLDSFGNFPESDARLMRWRLYGTGAAIALLLDRLGVQWRQQLQQIKDASLDEILARAVKFDSSKSSALAKEALDRFEFEEIIKSNGTTKK